MDESTIRERAQAHGDAVKAGDMNRAGSDLTKEGMAAAPAVMKTMPRPITSVEVTKVEQDGDDFLAQIRYAGDDSENVVESRWSERDGTPKIVDLKTV